MIPPWVRPESPETIRVIDDATVAFNPAFGRGMTQRGIFADPRWGLRRRYRGLRSDEKAAILNALNESRGQFNSIRVTPHTPIRGSFATSELLTNNMFSNGTTGWNAEAPFGLSVADRVMRITRLSSVSGNPLAPSAAATVVQYAPYVARAMIRGGLNASTGFAVTIGSTQYGNEYAGSAFMNAALLSIAGVPSGTTAYFGVEGSVGASAGDFCETPYVSLARCALADLAPNMLQQSNAFGTSPWTLTGATSAANGTTAPDGTTSDQYIAETGATSAHATQQPVTVSSTAADYAHSCYVHSSGRTWCWLQMLEGTGSTTALAYFNAATGAVGTTSTGANWANLRTFVEDVGGGWFRFHLVARKTNGATQINAYVGAASANGTQSYTGTNALVAHRLWHASFAQSSVPVTASLTTSSASTGTVPTGGAMYMKGWPVSTNGLLLTGDWFELNGELKQLTAPINSNSAGLAYTQFRPGLAGSPADNDPVVVFEPFGRFIYPGTREFENLFGIYGDCEMNFEEVYS